jgi:oligopeptide/dipeptide ABC transporter ATP-binding protein
VRDLDPDILLEVDDLRTYFFADVGVVKAVEGVSFRARQGGTLAIVGESGSGKSVTSLSIMRLVASPPGRIVHGDIWFRGKDGQVKNLARLDEPAMRRIRGNDIAMIFQEPMTSLNPVFTVGDQIAEMIRLHLGRSRREAMDRAAAMLEEVGIAEPRRRLREYPHELSGGMRQRVMIAMALCCSPALLIADEPTTALDVTIQAQILDLMRRLQRGHEVAMSILFITHDLGVVAEMADRVVVMYGGRVVEEATVTELYRRPRHPYTMGLLESIPRVDYAALDAGHTKRIKAIPGNVPNPVDLPPGCPFEPRCRFAIEDCSRAVPPLEETGDGHRARCIRWKEL